MTPRLNLGLLDSVILVSYVVAVLSIGWWAARRAQKTTTDYFLANRSIPWLVTTASFLATVISAVSFVGSPAEGYRADYRFLFSNVGDVAATFFVAVVFLPVFQKFKVTSIYEYLAHRFGQSVRTTCSGYFLLSRVLASTVRIVAIAKVLDVVTGESVSYEFCVLITGGIILGYTTLGGGRAIAWTDLLQFTLLITGALMAIWFLVSNVPGGLGGIIEAGRHAKHPDGTVYNKFNFLELLKPENLGLFLLLAVWGLFQSSAAYGTDQDMVQRLLACNNPRKARWSLMIAGVVAIPITFTFLSIGVGLYAYAQAYPQFVEGMKETDHVFPRFILTTMPEGLRGLLLAAVASAAMGSSDSALASLATAFTMDFYRPFWGKHASEERAVLVSKLSFIGFGLLFVVFALAVRTLDNLLWLGFRIVAFTYGPLLGVFLVAILTNWKVPPRRLIAVMLSITIIFLALALLAWVITVKPPPQWGWLFELHHWLRQHIGGLEFWKQLHEKYWRLYVIAGTLLVPVCAFFLRTKNSVSSPNPRL